MKPALDYRELAKEQRRMALDTPLPLVRLKHLAAAEKWELMAKESEWCTRETLAGQLPELFH